MISGGPDQTDAILRRVAAQISPQQFQTWFRRTRLRVSGEEVIIEVANRFYQAWMRRRYTDVVAKACQEVTGVSPAVDVRVAPEESFRAQPEAPARQTDLPAPVEPRCQLNPDYTFDRFVVGPGNELCHALSQSVGRGGPDSYNPLFIHAGPGMGKTHLLQAICHELLRRGRSRPIYLTCEAFTNHFLTALHSWATDAFRTFYQTADALLIDDVQFLSGRERTQADFADVFDTFHDAHKPIVAAADRAPEAIPTLDPRLSSRFRSGVVAPIPPPDIETRKLLVEGLAHAANHILPEDVIAFLAEVAPGSVRDLKGAVTHTVGMAILQGTPVTLSLAREVMGEYLQGLPSLPTPQRVLDAVSSCFGVQVADLQSSRRSRSVVLPRHTAMYLLRTRTKMSLTEIGSCLGGRDHTTVLHGINKIERLLREDPYTKGAVERISAQLGRG